MSFTTSYTEINPTLVKCFTNAMWCGDVTKVVEMVDTAMMGDIFDDIF